MVAATSSRMHCTTARSRLDTDDHQQAADAGPGEHALDHHRAGDQRADHEADDGHGRDRRVGQRMLDHDLAPGHALGRGGADIGLAQHLQHRAAGEARQDRRAADAERDDRQDGVRQLSLPPEGSQPSCTEKTSTSTSASTKLGTVKPATETIMMSAVGQRVAMQRGIDAGRDADRRA